MSEMVMAVLAAAGVVGFLTIVKNLLFICPPNEVLIFSGRTSQLLDGTTRGFRVVFGGRGWRIPILESVDRMSLNVMEVPIHVKGAYSKGQIKLNLSAIANVKVSSDASVIGNAIERFLGRDPEEIRRVAKETLEGHLRGVLAKMTPEQVNEDRLTFAHELQAESSEDLYKLGIQLDTLKIQHVSDDQSYLDSIGREAIANVVKDARMAESDAERDSEQAQAEQISRAKVQEAEVEGAIARLENECRRVLAELEQKVKSEEERTLAAAREARALAEQELQQVRSELEASRLYIDEVMPAEAERQAAEYGARASAAMLRARGEAVGQAVKSLETAWADAGEHALAIYLIEDIEKILDTAVDAVGRVQVDSLSVIDGGDGKTLSAYVAAYPEMLKAVFSAVETTTGIDIPGEISGRAQKSKAITDGRS